MIKYWKYGVVALIVALMCFSVHRLVMNGVQVRHERELQNLEERVVSRCQNSQKITKDVDYALQTDFSNLDSLHDASSRMYESTCATYTSGTPAERNESAEPRKPVRQTARIDATRQLELIKEAEKYRLQLIACQDFITKTWAELQ